MSVYERIVSQLLIGSISAPPLKAIGNVTRAALMAPVNDLRNLDIDVDRIKRLNIIVNSLSNVSKEKVAVSNYPYPVYYYQIGWGFDQTKENFSKFVKSWLRGVPSHIPDLVDLDRESTPKWKYVYVVTTEALTRRGYSELVSNFCSRYEPEVHEITRKLSTLIDSRSYDTVLQLSGGLQGE